MLKEKVLVVDDEKAIRDICLRTLKDEGYQAIGAESGEAAIKKTKEGDFDLLIIDVRMPGLNGLEAIQKIRNNCPELPVLIITGFGTIDTAVECLKQGVHGFLLKPFTAEELISAADFALERSRVIRENLRFKALLPLIETSKKLISEINLEELFTLFIKTALRETKAERASILLLEEKTSSLLPVVCSNGEECKNCKKEKLGEGIAGYAAQKGQAIVVSQVDSSPAKLKKILEEEGASSVLCVPLTTRGNVVGVIKLSKVSSQVPFNQMDKILLSILAGQAAIAIENARLYESLYEFYLATLKALVLAIETKDPYTKGHSEKVAKYSVRLAKELKLPPEELQIIEQAALLHDIGKIGISEEILLKPEPLSPADAAIVRQHPQKGAEILEPIWPLRELIPLILYHHEHWDGTGYPSRLKREQIPLGARILAVADAFDAMTSDRPYRKARSFSAAQAEIKLESGKAFDPKIGRAFLAIMEKEGAKMLSDKWGEEYLSQSLATRKTILSFLKKAAFKQLPEKEIVFEQAAGIDTLCTGESL
jgi:putative nucleotidyltransferase with HDIG domain